MLLTNVESVDEKAEQQSCSFAARKIAEALATIDAADTLHEGFYNACKDHLLGIEKIVALPLDVRWAIVKFLAVLRNGSNRDGSDHGRLALTSLSENELSRMTEELSRLRLRLGPSLIAAV